MAGWVAIKRPFGAQPRFQYTSTTFPDARENRIVVEAVEKRGALTVLHVKAGMRIRIQKAGAMP